MIKFPLPKISRRTKRARLLPPTSTSPVMQPMTAEGEASGTAGSKTSRIKFGDAFLAQIKVTNPEHSALWGTDWEEVPEALICSNKIFEYVATFAATVYIIPKGRTNAGHFLSQDSAESYWGGLIFDLKNRFQHSTAQTTKV